MFAFRSSVILLSVQASRLPVEIAQEGHPPAPYADVIESMRSSSTSLDQVLQMFGDYEHSGQLGLLPPVMAQTSTLSAGFLQLIAAFVSNRNQCPFCMKSHATVASDLLTEELVTAVLDNPEGAPLSDAEKALLRFVDKMNDDSASICPNDLTLLYECGWNDAVIYDAVVVCALFHFYHDWVDASVFCDLSPTSTVSQNGQMTSSHYPANLATLEA